MRKWIRENTSRGWVINLTPEGQQPPANTAVFNIETPVSIALFIRDQANNPSQPAEIKYAELHGLRKEKFDALSALTLDDADFVETGNAWTAGFVPSAGKKWESFPSLADTFPWAAPGVKPNKTWVYSPEREILEQRWNDLILEKDTRTKAAKFKETSSTSLYSTKRAPLSGDDTEQSTQDAFDNVSWPHAPAIVPVGYRSFDRQYIIADSRLIHRASPDLWASRASKQIFLVDPHTVTLGAGPSIMFSHLVPDMNYFKGSQGGRVLPAFHPDGSANVAAGLLETLSAKLDREVTAENLFSYVAGLLAHPRFIDRFGEELKFTSNRVPITGDTDLWNQLVEIGNSVIWLHTYGERGSCPNGFGSVLDPVFGVEVPSYDVSPGNAMPEKVTYDKNTRTINLGTGRWSNIDPRVWNYTVAGNSVVESWVGYRRKTPKGKKTSPLNNIVSSNWPSQWSREFSELLAVLTHLVHLEDLQADLLEQVLDGPLLSMSELSDSGVQWPKVPKDRKPRMSGELF